MFRPTPRERGCVALVNKIAETAIQSVLGINMISRLKELVKLHPPLAVPLVRSAAISARHRSSTKKNPPIVEGKRVNIH
jgi:hypothetical protein